MWRAFLILCTFVFGLGALSGLVIAGFGVVEGDFKTAAMMTGFAAFLSWGTYACRQDWRRGNQRREFEAENRR